MPCGTLNGVPLNAEGEDLQVPLDESWNLAKLQSGELNVKVYGMKVSPPVGKIRYMLTFYGVPFVTVNTQRKPDSEYKKMPVLDIGDRQVNDSYIIIKALSPILAGGALTNEQESLEKIITFELMTALEVGYGSGPDPKPKLKSLQEYADQFTEVLGSKNFFGGASPNITDVSLAGNLGVFNTAGCSCVNDFLCTKELASWYERMLAYGVDIYSKFPKASIKGTAGAIGKPSS